MVKKISVREESDAVKPQRTIYTTGYTGQNVEALKPLLDKLHAILCDIRYSPNSRVPQWRGDSLFKRLGNQYDHTQELGNKAFKSGRIEIVDMEDGLFGIDAAYEIGNNLVLMCGCREFDGCHRAVIADALIAKGYEVIEIEDWEAYLEELTKGNLQGQADEDDRQIPLIT
jgi:uncharacterized protein (DUF488 family)